MNLALKVVLTLGGLLLAFMGFGFLTDPASAAEGFGLAVEGAHGLTSIRADMTAFFIVSGVCFIWGAWGARRDPLLIGSALMLVALAMRVLSLATYGPFEGYTTPMIVEAALGALGLIAAKVLPQNSGG